MAHLAGFNQIFSGLRGGVTVGGGILMILLGLILLKILPLRLLFLRQRNGDRPPVFRLFNPGAGVQNGFSDSPPGFALHASWR